MTNSNHFPMTISPMEGDTRFHTRARMRARDILANTNSGVFSITERVPGRPGASLNLAYFTADHNNDRPPSYVRPPSYMTNASPAHEPAPTASNIPSRADHDSHGIHDSRAGHDGQADQIRNATADTEDRDRDFEQHQRKMEGAATTLLKGIGEDINRDGLKDTPARFIKAFQFLTSGYFMDGDKIVDSNSSLLSGETNNDIIIVKNLEIFSLCEDHMLPFFGKAHIGYIPANGITLGLSKIARIAEMFARRLQTQERLGEEIAAAIMEVSGAKGVVVVINAVHMCVAMRGVQKAGVDVVTTCKRGCFEEEDGKMAAFLALLQV